MLSPGHHNQCSGNTAGKCASIFSHVTVQFLEWGGGRGGEGVCVLHVCLPSSPYFLALIACKMVLKAASDDLLLKCADEHDQSPSFFYFSLFLFLSGFQQYTDGPREEPDFHRNDQVCIYRATT